ncbi:MAG: hypothetical protein HUU35_14725 [Armatimonadetes bacterium]|nr:hypothetical protein [Armatimonadota bacterium]
MSSPAAGACGRPDPAGAGGSTVDANRPLFAWRGVTGASEYVLQLSTSAQFPAQGLITATANDTELIYPANLPALTQGQQYFVRVGVFDQTQQALRFGPTTSFIRGAVQRFTTTITATLSGANLNGSRISIDGADTGEVTPAEFILSPKAGNAPYTIAAVFNDTDGTRYSGSVSYRPGVDNAAVRVPLTAAGSAPTVPTGLTATGQTDRVVLRWNPDPNLGTAATVAASYSVRRRSTTEEGPFSEIARVTAPSTPSNSGAAQLLYTDFNVRQGVRYYYQIVALSAAGVESVPSVTANAVAGIGVIQVLAPQDNQTFEADITGPGWDTSMDFAWVAVPNAVRYIFEIGLDPDLHRLLSNGNQIIAAGAQPSTTVEVSDTAPTGFQFFNDGDANTATLYWRVTAVDENNLIVNQTEARRVFVNQPGLMQIPAQ